MWRLHNNSIFTPGDKIYSYEKCIWIVFVDVHYILHWVSILDFVWGIFKLFSNNIIQQYNFDIQQHYIVYDYHREKTNKKFANKQACCCHVIYEPLKVLRNKKHHCCGVSIYFTYRAPYFPTSYPTFCVFA